MRQWVAFNQVQLQAAAAVGDVDRANKLAVETAEMMFPQLAQHRREFCDGSKEMLKSLQGVGFKIRRADGGLA